MFYIILVSRKMTSSNATQRHFVIFLIRTDVVIFIEGFMEMCSFEKSKHVKDFVCRYC